MNVLSAWKDSLELFRPKNAKLLGLVSLNAFAQGLGVFFRNVIWWFVPLHVLLLVLFSYSGLEDSLYSLASGLNSTGVSAELVFFLSMAGIFFVTIYPIFFVCCLIVRPSVNRKTVSYFLSFYNMFFMQFFTVLMFMLVCFCITKLLTLFVPIVGKIFLVVWLLLCFDIVLVPCILFACDSPGMCKDVILSWVQGVKMVVYNAPIFFFVALGIGIMRALMGLVLTAIYYSRLRELLYAIGNTIDIVLNKVTFGYYSGHWFVSTQAYNIEIYVVFFLVCLFATNIISTIYIKKLHDNKDLYL